MLSQVQVASSHEVLTGPICRSGDVPSPRRRFS